MAPWPSSRGSAPSCTAAGAAPDPTRETAPFPSRRQSAPRSSGSRCGSCARIRANRRWRCPAARAASPSVAGSTTRRRHRSLPAAPENRRSAETRADRCAGSTRSACRGSAATDITRFAADRCPAGHHCPHSRASTYHTAMFIAMSCDFRAAIDPQQSRVLITTGWICDPPGSLPIGSRSPARTPEESREPESQKTTRYAGSWS